MAEPSALDAAITGLNAHRAALGDAAIDAAIDALRRHATAAPEAPTPTLSRRLQQVSVLFVDVAHSTELLARIGPEDADEVLGRALERFASVVQQHGGQVLRFTGDGLKAVFGAAGLREDEAVHAVRAGLAIIETAASHATQVQAQLQGVAFGVRVGIHTGPVLLGGGAEAEHGAIGHAVHLAARMEQSAPIGRLRISQDTHAQVRGLFQVQPQPPLWVKGHAEPLLTFLVLGVEADPERAVQRGVEGLTTPMIGREAELQLLLDAHAEACSAGQLQALTVLADAGVGKTRLRRELLERLSLEDGGPGLLQARAHPDSSLQPYGLLRQLLARWLAIADDLDATSARARLVAGLGPWLGARGVERAQLIGQLIGLDFGHSAAVQALGPRDLREQAFVALVDTLHALARRAPLVLMLDDLHWADDASLDFVQRLAAPAPVPLLLVMLARPVLLERRPHGLAAEGCPHRLLRVQPLGQLHAPALARALLQHLQSPPEALLQLLVQRADGNPFYMEELVRMLIDDGVIDARRQPWRLRHGWQDSARVPGTLVGVLQARLQALPADELAALQRASVVGPVFWDRALAAIDTTAPATLPALQGRGLVVARAHSAFSDTQEQAFHHQLLHDVTYDTVLKAERREGHARVAAWLAERVADRAGEFLGITAAHFERAGDSAQAPEYYDRARDDAASRFAHSAAVAYADCVLRQSALVSPMWRYQVMMDKMANLENLGRLEESAAVVAQMAAHAQACDSDAMRADVLCVHMLNADREGRAAEAADMARRAVALAEPVLASGPAALAHGELAWLALTAQRFDESQRHIDRGLRWARLAAAIPWRDGGAVGYEHQIRIIGIEVLLQQRHWHAARGAVGQALATLPPHRRRERLSLLLQRARIEVQLGDLEAARRTCEDAAAAVAEFDIARLSADVALARAEVALAEGDLATMERCADEAELLARPVAHAVALAGAWRYRAAAAAARGGIAQARTLWADARRQYESMDSPHQTLEVRVELAGLQRLEGQADAAATEVLAVLEAAQPAAPADGAATVVSHTWPLLAPLPLWQCQEILAGAGHPLAPTLRQELQRRLDEQLAQLPDEAARQRLVQAGPHWRAAAGG